MAFSNPLQSNKAPESKSKKEKAILENIEVLGEEHFKADLAYKNVKKDLKEIEGRRVKVKDVKVELKKLESKLEESKSTLSNLALQISVAKEKLQSMDFDYSQKLAEFNTMITLKEKELNETADSRRDDLNALEARISKKESKLEDLSFEGEKREKEIKELEEKMLTLKADVIEFEKLTKKLPELKNKITGMEALEKSLRKSIDLFSKECIAIKDKVAKAQEKADKFIKENEGIRAKFDKEMKDIREEADERDGSLSEREGWLDDKTRKLKKAKADIEKHINRPLKHIII